MKPPQIPSRLAGTPMLDLRRVRHFVMLAETLNFRAAAARLHMAQPPLSVSIQKLEAELGTRLFVRGPGGVSLTATGQTVLLEARQLLFHNQQLVEQASAAAQGQAGMLRVGFVGSTTYGPLQKIVPLFRGEYPAVELVLREATSARIIQQVESGELDVGLVRTPLMVNTRLALTALTTDSFVAALPRVGAAAPVAAHKAARGSARRSEGGPKGKPADGPESRFALRLEDLAGEPFVMYTMEGAGLYAMAMLACQLAGFVPRVAQEATQIQTVLSLVESGLGVALVPSVMERYASDKISYRRIADLSPAVAIGLAVTHASDRASPAAVNFARLARKAWALL